MSAIWKFPLEITDYQTVDMPQGAAILSVEEQYARICVWALVDPDAPKVARSIQISGTGHERPAFGGFIGTVVTCSGALVWHVFDCGERKETR